jgi:hypothetical protein
MKVVENMDPNLGCRVIKSILKSGALNDTNTRS